MSGVNITIVDRIARAAYPISSRNGDETPKKVANRHIYRAMHVTTMSNIDMARRAESGQVPQVKASGWIGTPRLDMVRMQLYSSCATEKTREVISEFYARSNLTETISKGFVFRPHSDVSRASSFGAPGTRNTARHRARVFRVEAPARFRIAIDQQSSQLPCFCPAVTEAIHYFISVRRAAVRGQYDKPAISLIYYGASVRQCCCVGHFACAIRSKSNTATRLLVAGAQAMHLRKSLRAAITEAQPFLSFTTAHERARDGKLAESFAFQCSLTEIPREVYCPRFVGQVLRALDAISVYQFHGGCFNTSNVDSKKGMRGSGSPLAMRYPSPA